MMNLTNKRFFILTTSTFLWNTAGALPEDIKTRPHINISSKNDFQEIEKISTSQKNTESSASWRELIPVLDDAKNLFEERELIIGPEISSEEFNQAIQKLNESLEFDVEILSEVLKPNNDFKDKLWSTLFKKFDHKNPRPYIACLLAFFYKKLIHIYLYSSKRDMIFIKQLYQTLSFNFISKNTPLKKKITQLFKNKEKFTSEEMDTFREIESMGPREATKKVVDNTRRLIKIFMDNFSTTQALLEALSEWVKNKELFQKHSKPELESYQYDIAQSLQKIMKIKKIVDQVSLELRHIEKDVQKVKM
ncbi:hypothetical protein [Holospora curviuscula]|uniref:Uncharacterized protein n=1 Tax=Holospora curviuscula TaxID=1082868 RepID=A0A2S5R7G5_9PROT|nr:hypothetical protein [Holospora curviuscula]PPE03122.1 hypothetical protein HCUR_01445 [Holospora curviuscula]